MNEKKIMLKGLQQEKKEELDKLGVKIEDNIRLINHDLYLYDGIENINIESAKINMEELTKSIKKYKELKKEIKKIQEEL